MKNIYRILSIILAVTVASAALPFSAFSAEETYLVYATASPLDGSGGTISGEDKYASGEQVTISIAPNTDEDYCAAQWGLSDIGEGVISAVHGKTSHTFTMPDRNVQISITFVRHSYIAYSDLKDGTHQNKCFYCGTENGAPEEHIDAHGGGDGTTPSDGYCDLCSASLHTHSYSSYWSSDEEGHYHSCECGMTSDFAEHTSSREATEDAAEVCTVCGYELSPQLEHALVMVERDKKKEEEAATKDNEEPLATFSVNTYTVAADGTQTYIPVKKSMQYAIPVDTSSIPENATLALYRINEDGTRTKQEILSAVNNLVIAQTDGNSDYILVYELAEEHTHSGGSATCTEKAICEICGTEYGEVLGHDFRGIGMDENEHWSKCKRCDATGEKQAHTIDGGLCTVCEYQPIKDGLSTDTVVAIAVAAIAVLVCGVCIFVFKKKK